MNDRLMERVSSFLKLRETKKDRTMKVLGEYNLGNILAFSSEFADQAQDMMRAGGELRAGRIIEELKRDGPNPNKHHMVPVISVILRGKQHYMRYMQEWRNERGDPDTRLTTAGNEIPISRKRAHEIMKRFSDFNEYSGM